MLDEYFMLRWAVWEAAVEGVSADTHAMLCLRCIEEGVGRELQPADFADCPINRELYDHAWSVDVVRRMGTPAQWSNAESINGSDDAHEGS